MNIYFSFHQYISKTAYFTSLQNISTADSVLPSFRTLVQQYNYLTFLQYVSTTVYLPFLQYMYVSTTVYVLFYFPHASSQRSGLHKKQM